MQIIVQLHFLKNVGLQNIVLLLKVQLWNTKQLNLCKTIAISNIAKGSLQILNWMFFENHVQFPPKNAKHEISFDWKLPKFPKYYPKVRDGRDMEVPFRLCKQKLSEQVEFNSQWKISNDHNSWSSNDKIHYESYY